MQFFSLGLRLSELFSGANSLSSSVILFVIKTGFDNN